MPPQQTLAQLLDALHTDAAKRSATVRLRPRLTLIEQALAAGATLQSVRDALATEGLDLPFNTFTSALRRLRLATTPKPARPQGTPTLTTPAEPLAAPPLGDGVHADAPAIAEPQALDPRPPSTAHDPRELDRIINDVPDLDALARAHRASRKKAP